ncbi:MAG: serine/threonine-protein kinase [Hyphomonadaceae bacterium]|nr:serine/threonine-protein kinase [Hyphomonadaceae bacterium]
MICPQCQSQNPDNARFCENCGTRIEKAIEAPKASEPPRAAPYGVDLAPGDVFAGRYRIESQIGRGWMGVVYAATDNRSDHRLALKLIRPERLVVKDAQKRIVRDMVLSRDIRHRNVVAVYDVGEVAGIAYIATEFLQGTSLSQHNRKRLTADDSWPIESAVEIVRQLLSGLKAAHEVGVVHRDLKPANILLLEDPSTAIILKITDFALAAASGSIETGATSMGGTYYMSPEQIASPDAVRPSADIYALSAIFYELLIGVAPTGSWQPPSQGREDVPPALDRLIERGLSNNPRGRPQTADEYLEELDRAMAKPDAPKPPPIPGPAPPPAPKPLEIAGVKLTPVMIGGIAAGIVAIVAAIMFASNGTKAGDDVSGDDDFTPANVTPDPDPAPLPPVSPPPPPPTPAPSGYELLSGYWTDDYGNYFDVVVAANGAVSGRARQGPVAGYDLAGQFSGDQFEFQIGNQNGALTGSYGARTDACHVQYQAVDAYGQPLSAMLHMNHLPGQPCP